VAGIEVKGLTQALANLKKLSADVQLKLSRDALRDASWVIANAIRGSTYTTFTKVTGAIQRGFSVQVAQQPHTATELDAYVVEYQQGISGTSPSAIAFRKSVIAHRRRRSRQPIQLQQVAFWWRFLEFGTQPRRKMRTPAFSRHVSKRTDRQRKRLAAFNASPSRGGIQGRSWVRPAFSASAETAIETFRNSLVKALQQETDQLPK
jgi:HK97 gp10 family phage protein